MWLTFREKINEANLAQGNNGAVHELSLEAKSIEDQQKIFGNPSCPTTSGILGYIDSLTNQNYPNHFFGIITIEVNEIGMCISHYFNFQ